MSDTSCACPPRCNNDKRSVRNSSMNGDGEDNYINGDDDDDDDDDEDDCSPLGAWGEGRGVIPRVLYQ